MIGLVSTGLLMSIHGSVTPIPQEISPNLPVVALTFDDGPNARFTPEILDILYEQQVPATFLWWEIICLELPSFWVLISDSGWPWDWLY